MEDLPLGRIAALVPEFAVKDLSLVRTLMIIIIIISRNAYTILEGSPEGKKTFREVQT